VEIVEVVVLVVLIVVIVVQIVYAYGCNIDSMYASHHRYVGERIVGNLQ
jgi:hypothetical protein